jgi:hypothetical protein
MDSVHHGLLLYWLYYRDNNQVAIVIEAGSSVRVPSRLLKNGPLRGHLRVENGLQDAALVFTVLVAGVCLTTTFLPLWEA